MLCKQVFMTDQCYRVGEIMCLAKVTSCTKLRKHIKGKCLPVFFYVLISYPPLSSSLNSPVCWISFFFSPFSFCPSHLLSFFDFIFQPAPFSPAEDTEKLENILRLTPSLSRGYNHHGWTQEVVVMGRRTAGGRKRRN